jgi:hypothetical protein
MVGLPEFKEKSLFDLKFYNNNNNNNNLFEELIRQGRINKISTGTNNNINKLAAKKKKEKANQLMLSIFKCKLLTVQ